MQRLQFCFLSRGERRVDVRLPHRHLTSIECDITAYRCKPRANATALGGNTLVRVPAELILPNGSALLEDLSRAARDDRCVFFAGLPGVGKTLLVQQLALLAHSAGRPVHLLQWDVARLAFETPELLSRYPEVDSVTHAALRKAVGVWVRDAVQRWDLAYPDASHLLIGETPLIGNRLIELARIQDDAAERVLQSARTEFLVPAPSERVRAAIEAARAREMERPTHAREVANAPLGLVQAQWSQVLEAASLLDIAPRERPTEYAPGLYTAVYTRLLRHRHHRVLPIDDVLVPRGSAYVLDIPIRSELRPGTDDVKDAMAVVENWDPDDLATEVERWYAL
jgi:energy-coupling factor transporter ATP-binding protein EcfA2